MISLSTMRAAMVAADFNFAGCGAVTSIPAFLSSLNATYTCASVKNVLQGSSLTQLASNQFGTTLDPSTGLYGALIEPAATNLVTYSEGAAANWTVSGVTDAASTFFGRTNALYFVDNAPLRYARKTVSITSGTVYTVSVFVIMDDGSVPVVGTSLLSGDLALFGDSAVISSAALVTHQGGDVYRISASVTAGSTASRLFGVYKDTTQSSKAFRISAIQVESGNIATSYIATTSATVTRAAEKLVVPLWKNNLKYSTDPTGTGWTRTNTTLTSGQSDPFGGTTAWKAEATTTATTNFYSSGTVAVSSTMTASVYVYAGATASGTINFILRNGSTATNFTQGTFTNATGAISGAGWTSTAVPGYAGWYRLTFTQATGISVGDSLNFQIGFTTTFTAGDWFRYCAPQLEPGSTATTYIPTVNNLEYQKNYLANSTFLGGAAAPIGWTQPTADGTSTPVASTRSAGAVAYLQTGSSNRPFFYQITPTLSANTTYTFSMYIESVSAAFQASQAMSIVSVPAGATVSYVVCEANPAGTAGASIQTGLLVCQVAIAGTAGTVTVRAGLGANSAFTGSIQFSTPQLELGATATTYEPTGSFVSMPNANIPGFSSAGYTLVADLRLPIVPTDVTARRVVEVGDGTTANFCRLAHYSDRMYAEATSSSVAQSSTIIKSSYGVVRHKNAVSTTTNSQLSAVDGTAATADTSLTMPAALTLLAIGSSSAGSFPIGGYIYRAQLIPKVLTQAQLNGLTQ